MTGCSSASSDDGNHVLRAVESYRYLQAAVGSKRAREWTRAELVARAASVLAGPAWTAVNPPSLDSLVASMPSTMEATEVFAWAGIHDADDYLREFESVTSSLDAAYVATDLTCPPEWAVESVTSTILYVLVRATKPEHVVETGIANGHSSFIILEALRHNGAGHLTSIDVRNDVGGLVSPDLAQRWSKVVISDERPSIARMESEIGTRRPVDIFFHDGDHRYLGQALDYRLGRRLLRPGGLLVSDDVNTTSAWVDAQHHDELGKDGMILLDRRKAVGFSRIGS